MTVIARQQYDDRPVLVSDLDCSGDPGLTKQADAKDCDINAIFKRFEKTGQLPDLIAKNPMYGDFSSVPSFQESLAIVRLAQEQFAALDVAVRNRFENDPEKFLAFANDEKNIDELEKMGLLKPEIVEARKAARLAADEEIRKADLAKREQAEQDLIAKIKAELNK